MSAQILLLAVAVHVPVLLGASGRELDWESIVRSVEERAKELKKKPCTAQTSTEEIEALIDDNQQIATFFDVAARNLPPSLPSRDRARKLNVFVTRSVAAYERSFHCRPLHERREVVLSALDLLGFAVRDLELHPGDNKELSLSEYKEHETRLRSTLPRPPAQEKVTCPPCARCEGPPPARGCAVGGTGSSPGLVLLSIAMAWRRRPRQNVV